GPWRRTCRGPAARPWPAPSGMISAMPQDASFPERRQVEDELRLACRLQGEPLDRVGHALEVVGLSSEKTRRIGALSHGQRRRLGVAQALLGDEPLVILDEPTAGVDPRTALEMRRRLRDWAEGRTLIWSSHDLSEVEEICTHALILDRAVSSRVGRWRSFGARPTSCGSSCRPPSLRRRSWLPGCARSMASIPSKPMISIEQLPSEFLVTVPWMK
ncbi:MAG: ABC transporter ATP-binding protein, partial [Myxococcales bacterium]|nr:ABC transporter ATP-binding protein [Myxococcales bacterium]